MAEEMVLKFRRAAEKLYSRKDNFWDTVSVPIIIAMKGDPFTGRKLLAFYVASILKWPLIKKQDFVNYEENSEETQGRLWENIRNLARSQLTLGRSIVIDVELANQYEFDKLQELSEITKTPLTVFECRLYDEEGPWKLLEIADYLARTIVAGFVEKPTSQNINLTNYDMGEIPKILVEMEELWSFEKLVSGALNDLRAHIFPETEAQKANDCDHLFKFTNVEDEYKMHCCRCMQLVSGSVYRCIFCRFIVHRTCSYFPELLSVKNNYTQNTIPLNLRHGVPELDADASCSCCKQLLSSSTSSLYYSSSDGLVLFDFECLFLLPTKVSTKIHKHELIRGFRSIDSQSNAGSVKLFSIKECKECDASINEGSILYYCPECHIPFDAYCVFLPETVVFDRHRHPFKLSLVPRVDPYPYYCEVCQNERDTERWIYHCKECDYPSHPRCILEMPCLPRHLSAEISITKKKSKKKLTDTKSHHCSSDLSSEFPEIPIEKVMGKELPLQHRPEAKELRLLFKEQMKEIELPIIIVVKGNSHKGRKLVAFALAAAFHCLLIDEEHICNLTNAANGTKQLGYQEFSQIALSQLQIGLSVVIDCNLSHESEFFILRDFSRATETPLFIVECKQSNENKLDDFQSIINLHSDYEYDVADTPMFLQNITTPTYDDIKTFMPDILHFISGYSRERSEEPEIISCYRHRVTLGLNREVLEGDICNRCSKQLSTPILKCDMCSLVIHKTCTKLPQRIHVYTGQLDLEKYGDDNDQIRCDCCSQLVKGYAYTFSEDETFLCLDLDCLFTPPQPGINLHEHPIVLQLYDNLFQCGACGLACNQKLRYTCLFENSEFAIGVKCGWLEETVTFDRHRHPFHLILSPEHVSNQYYCEVCGEERDKKHWVYCCVECDYFIHIHCLVPTGGCPRSGFAVDACSFDPLSKFLKTSNVIK